jgi:hypothetical protein
MSTCHRECSGLIAGEAILINSCHFACDRHGQYPMASIWALTGLDYYVGRFVTAFGCVFDHCASAHQQSDGIQGKGPPRTDWKPLRRKWDLLHRWRVVLLTIAFGFLIMTVVIRNALKFSTNYWLFTLVWPSFRRPALENGDHVSAAARKISDSRIYCRSPTITDSSAHETRITQYLQSSRSK